jgi:vacuolar-type H+-ATPase subunit H
MIELSTDYTQTLKSIKDAEESSSKTIDERKKMLAESLEKARAQSDIEITSVKAQAEALVADEIAVVRKAAEADSKKLIESTVTQAQAISRKKIAKSGLKKIIEETLLSEFTGE